MDRAKALAVILLLKICALLPLGLVRVLGRGLARLYWPFNARSRRVTERNIALAFPHLTAREQRALSRSSIAATAELMAEMGQVWLRSWEHVRSLILEVEGADLVTQAQAEGRGIIVLAPHLGNWEVLGLHLATLGSTVSLYEPPRLADLGPMIRGARQRNGATVVPTDTRGLAKLLRSVRGGDISGILPDQCPSDPGSGMNVEFMGIPCFTGTLASNMIRRTGALALFGYAKRVPGGFKVGYFPADELIYSDDDRTSLMTLNRGVEACLSDCPAQYQWEYKRFRVRPRQGPGVYAGL
ncbi:lysophospholipid acyltransferase family protein [Parahaliea maris]|uniref:Lysophospholipid acyltransferase family protein n=1 Tax=Parahaliea maris TaxID=2716870 RepID=A0A5C9A1R0_9GAMM|nr:lysophospholipid acyltransferase family protein [Parahaliea maris]TXS93710.1 lysophospholipid acyltransferase family protein [Parahaliea maris]